MLEHSLYDVFLCGYFGGDGCSGNANPGTDSVSETTLEAGAGWGTRNDYFGVSYDGDVG